MPWCCAQSVPFTSVSIRWMQRAMLRRMALRDRPSCCTLSISSSSSQTFLFRTSSTGSPASKRGAAVAPGRNVVPVENPNFAWGSRPAGGETEAGRCRREDPGGPLPPTLPVVRAFQPVALGAVGRAAQPVRHGFVEEVNGPRARGHAQDVAPRPCPPARRHPRHRSAQSPKGPGGF